NAAADIIAPSLSHPTIVQGWGGLYENTPDHNAFIGRDTTFVNYVYAAGFSGHGFLQAPAVGELVTDIYLDRESFMDPSPFHLSRLDNPDCCFHEDNII
ncbi:MAG: FAD-binding oxidoreductase, partial [Bowdeniella nasicola]|nr:FAD-binding oxidoreductase [Bowdeniella nasicola]